MCQQERGEHTMNNGVTFLVALDISSLYGLYSERKIETLAERLGGWEKLVAVSLSVSESIGNYDSNANMVLKELEETDSGIEESDIPLLKRLGELVTGGVGSARIRPITCDVYSEHEFEQYNVELYMRATTC